MDEDSRVAAWLARPACQLAPWQQAAWARVSILLNTGDVPAAEAAALEASEVTDWSLFGDYSRFMGPEIYETANIPAGWVWFEPDEGRCLVACEVLEQFGSGLLADLVRVLDDTMVEPGFHEFDMFEWARQRAGL